MNIRFDALVKSIATNIVAEILETASGNMSGGRTVSPGTAKREVGRESPSHCHSLLRTLEIVEMRRPVENKRNR